MPPPLRSRGLSCLFAGALLSASLLGRGLAATIVVAPRLGAARIFSPAVVQALDSQIRSLQPSLGSSQPMAQALLQQAFPGSASLSGTNADGIAAVLIPDLLT